MAAELASFGVSKIYQSRSGEFRPALIDVSVQVAEGEFVSIVGPSGCGKTTFLKICAGLVTPTSGHVSFRDEAGPVPPGKYGIVFQNPALLKWRKIIDNVVIPAIVLKLDRKAAERRAHELLALMKLTDVATQYPGELSGGMQQRVSIARALLHDPPVLFMDEPFGALDAFTRERVGLELQELHLHMEKPKTVMFVTHSIQEAVLLSDRVLVFSATPGEVVADVRVDLPRPRGMSDAMTLGFREIEAEIRAQLGENDGETAAAVAVAEGNG